MFAANQLQPHPYILSIALGIGFFVKAPLFVALKRLLQEATQIAAHKECAAFDQYLAVAEAEDGE